MALTAGTRKALLFASTASAAPFVPIGTPVELGTQVSANGASLTAVITTTADAPAGSCIWVPAVATGDTVISSIADSASNTYAPVTNYTGGGSGNVIKGFWCIIPALLPSGSTITVTFSSTNGRKFIAAFSTTGISGIDLTASGATGTSTTPSITTAALAQANSQAWATTYVGAGYLDTWTEAAGWTSHTTAVTETRIMRTAHINLASASAVTYAPTNSVSRTWTMNAVVFKGN